MSLHVLRGRGDDTEKEHAFVRDQITQRLSAIVGELGFTELQQELQNETFAVSHLPDDQGPNFEDFVFKENVESGTGNCLDVSWFFLEHYVYRYILGQLGYFKPDSPGYLKDPWSARKDEALTTAIASWKLIEPMDDENTSLERLLLFSLWSQQEHADLANLDTYEGTVLLDHRTLAASYIGAEETGASGGNGTIIIVLDECGGELVNDLRLATTLALKHNVELHVKPYPVSRLAVTKRDVEHHVERLRKEGTKLGETLASLFEAKKIVILEDDFYGTPQGFSDAPDDLKTKFHEAVLVILKGDNAYRRLVNDLLLPLTMSFIEAVERFTPTHLLALRVCHSPILVGLSVAEKKIIDAKGTSWFTTSATGIIQYSHAPIAEVPEEPEPRSFSPGKDGFGGDENVSKRHEGMDNDDDVLQDAEDMFWIEAAMNSGGIDLYLEEIGVHDDPERPFISAHLPGRVKNAFDFFCESKPDSDPTDLVKPWTILPKSQKSSFEDMARRDQIRYERELIERARQVALILNSININNKS